MTGYTVVDVETTGLSPEKHDRVVEVGVVYVSEQGSLQDHWSTLVNPQRDVGPTRVHGITATDVANAPTFSEVAPYLLRAVAGRTMVAHNASFDLRFLAREFLRADIALTDLPLRGLCTMQWSSSYLSASSRRLIDCCRASGIQLLEAHSAHADALATAQLLAHYLSLSPDPPWRAVLDDSGTYPWPSYTGAYPEMRMLRRTQARDIRQDAWLDQVVSRMPRAAAPHVDAYLAVLEMAMLDGFLAEHETSQLISVAVESGLSRGQVLDLHGDYLRAMAQVALQDHVVTPDERADLERTASMLGLRHTDVEAALAQADRHTASAMAATVVLSSAGISLSRGDRVVFTGDMAMDRAVWEARARAAGLEPGGVTKKTAVVVASDPNSLSGKAAKARSYGIPIMTEAAFARLIEHGVGRGPEESLAADGDTRPGRTKFGALAGRIRGSAPGRSHGTEGHSGGAVEPSVLVRTSDDDPHHQTETPPLNGAKTEVARRLQSFVVGTMENGVGPLTGSVEYAHSRLRDAGGGKGAPPGEPGSLPFQAGSPAAEAAIVRIVRESVGAAATQGFVTGLGGFVVAIVALPANIAGSLVINARMVGCIAYLRGYDLKDPHTQAMLMLVVAGSSAQNAASAVGVKVGTALTKSAIRALPIEVIRRVNQRAGLMLVAKYGTKRSALTLAKGIPVAGALVGGTVDGTLTRVMAATARKLFPVA